MAPFGCGGKFVKVSERESREKNLLLEIEKMTLATYLRYHQSRWLRTFGFRRKRRDSIQRDEQLRRSFV